MCTTNVNISMDFLIKLYHDVESDSENEDDNDFENTEDSGGT